MPNVSQAETGEIDATAHRPLSLLIAAALLWLLAAGALALLNFAQTLSPSLLAECPALSYGRVVALQDTAFVYGWAANAGFAVALWILGRLGGSPLRSLNWVVVGGLFWNLGVLLGLIGIVFGQGSSIPWLQLPAYVQPLLLVAFAAIAAPGVLAWTGRNRQATFAAQWYAVAALFLFPWLFSAAQLTLACLPVRGVLQAIAAGWFSQSVWTLWLAPLALAAAYYLVPKITGRTLPSYDFASLSFWTLVFIGAWTGGRHLVGGPVPAWIPSMAIVSCALLTFHYLIVALNLRGAFGQSGTALRFVAFGVAAYVIGGFADAVTAMRTVASAIQFTWFAQAQTQLALTGAFSMILFGALYFLVPRLASRPWPSTPLIRAHFSAAILGTLVLVFALAAAGIAQSQGLANPAATFAEITSRTRVWIQIAAAAQAVLLFGNALFALHFVRLLAAKPVVEPNLFRQPATMEATVS